MGGNSQSKQNTTTTNTSSAPATNLTTSTGGEKHLQKEKTVKLEEEDQWLYEYLLQYLTSPMWQIPIYDFLEQNCIIFDDEQENQFEYTECHNQFKVMIESTFDDLMKEIGIDQQQLYKLILIGLKSKAHRKIFQQLLIVDNFVVFKQLMVKKNQELELEVLKELDKADKTGVHKQAIKKKELEAEQAEIQHAIAISVASQKQKDRLKELEDEELEKAIQMSQMEYQSINERLEEQVIVAQQSNNKVQAEKQELDRIRLEMELKEKILAEQQIKDDVTKRAIEKLASDTEATNARLRQLEQENRLHKEKLMKMAEEAEEMRRQQESTPTPAPAPAPVPVPVSAPAPVVHEKKQEVKKESNLPQMDMSSISNLPPLEKKAPLPVIPSGRFDQPVDALIKEKQLVEEQIDNYQRVNDALKNQKAPEKVVDDQPKQETLEERKKRLLAQRELLRKKKQQQREAELQEYQEAPDDKQSNLKTQSSLALDETQPAVSTISDQELKKRQALMSKIKSTVNN